MKNNQASTPRWMKNVVLGAVLGLALIVCSDAFARIGKIPPPPAKAPAAGESPATDQPAPEDPENPPPMPAPDGKACTKGPDQKDCDPGHPGNEKGAKPGNKPPDAWYTAMAGEMYNLQQSLEKMSSYSQTRDTILSYYSTWALSVTQQYYSLGFRDGVPISYPYGRMTRGDFNYYFFYWLQPIYYNILYQAADYYRVHSRETNIVEYKEKLRKVVSSYHGLVKCNYGFNGNDNGALEDSEANAEEAAAGIR